MKTFKLISLQITGDHGLIEIALEDGLIINKEDEHRTWLLEAFVSASYEDYFQSLLEDEKVLILQLVISRKANDPAYYHSKLFHIKKLDEDHISLLFKGHLNRSRSNYAEQVLANLIEKGIIWTRALNTIQRTYEVKEQNPSS